MRRKIDSRILEATRSDILVADEIARAATIMRTLAAQAHMPEAAAEGWISHVIGQIQRVAAEARRVSA